jgi:hypothetical protein
MTSLMLGRGLGRQAMADAVLALGGTSIGTLSSTDFSFTHPSAIPCENCLISRSIYAKPQYEFSIACGYNTGLCVPQSLRNTRCHGTIHGADTAEQYVSAMTARRASRFFEQYK